MDTKRVLVSLYANGQIVVGANGPAEHAEAIRQSLQNCALLQPVFNAERFVANLRDRAVPEAVIAEILETAGIADDEAYFRSK